MVRLRGLLCEKLIDNMVLVGHTCCKYQKLQEESVFLFLRASPAPSR